MNLIEARVKRVRRVEKLHLVSFDYHGAELTMMSLELDATVREGVMVELGFKSSAVGIAKNLAGEISYSNRVPVILASVEKGELLSAVKLQTQDCVIESVITTASFERMGLCEGDDVEALIKASELFVVRVLK